MSPKIDWGKYGALIELKYNHTYHGVQPSIPSYGVSAKKLFVGKSLYDLEAEFNAWFNGYDNVARGSSFLHDPKVSLVTKLERCIERVISAKFEFKPYESDGGKLVVARKTVSAYHTSQGSWLSVNPRINEYNYRILDHSNSFSDPVSLYISSNSVFTLSGWFDVTSFRDCKAAYIDYIESRFKAKLEDYKQDKIREIDHIENVLKSCAEDRKKKC